MKALTMIEILVVIAISALIFVAAAPQYLSFMRNSAATSMANELAATLRQARLEAMQNEQFTAVCPISPTTNPDKINTTDDINICIANTYDWNAWKLFKGTNNTGADITGVSTIRMYLETLSGAIKASQYGAVVFQPSGVPTDTSITQTFTIKPQGCSGNNAYSITLTNGDINVQKNVSCSP